MSSLCFTIFRIALQVSKGVCPILLLLTASVFGASGTRSTFIPNLSNYTGTVVLDAVHQQIFVAWLDLDRIDVLSTADYHLIQSIPVRSPSALDISPDSSTLGVATRSAHLLFFSTTTYAKSNDVVLRDSSRGISGFLYVGAGNAIVRADGITAYYNSASNTLINISGAGGGATGPYFITGLMARSSDYSRVIFADTSSEGGVQIVDGNTGAVVQTLSLGSGINGVAVNRDASRYAICISGQLVLLDSTINQVYQDQQGCYWPVFSPDGSILYRETGGTFNFFTQAFDVTKFTTISQTKDLYSNSNGDYSAKWMATDSTGMVYGTLTFYPTGAAFMAVDTTQASTPAVPTDDPLKIIRVADNIGSPQGGDQIRILCTGADQAAIAAISVTIGGKAASILWVFTPEGDTNSLRMISVTTPPGTAGFADVVLKVGSNSDTAAQGFQYVSRSQGVAISGTPTYLLFDSLRNKLYASNGAQVEVIDPATLQLGTPLVPVSGKLANSHFDGISLSPDGARLYIADAGANLIHRLDLNTPGSGTSFDPGALLGQHGSISPSRVYELASGTLIGSAQGSATTYVDGTEIYLIDASLGSAQWVPGYSGSQVGGFLSGTTKDGKYALINAIVDGLISSSNALWDDSESTLITSPALAQNGAEEAINDDGSVIANGGSTPGILTDWEEILDFQLNPAGFIPPEGVGPTLTSVGPPIGTPGLSFHPSGALLYVPGNKGYSFDQGAVAIYDVNRPQMLAMMIFPRPLITSYAPWTEHLLTTDPTGSQFYAVTQNGIWAMTLASVPLSVGHIQPDSGAPAGGQTITIRGSGFQSGATLMFGEVSAAAVFVDANTLSAVVPPLSTGWQSLTVTNPGGTSYTFPGAFQVIGTQPTPSITGFSPVSVPVETGFDTPLSVTVVGSGFANYDTVTINGQSADGAFVDSSHIQATIPASLTRQTGPLAFAIISPYTGISNVAELPMVNPVPVLNSFSPSSIITGAANVVVLVIGTNFVGGSLLQWNGQNLQTTVSPGLTPSGTQMLDATVPPALVASSGSATLTVFNPAPAGGTSNSLTITIEPAHPTVTYPAQIDFGKITVAQAPVSTSVSLSNTGTGSYTMSLATVSGGPFTVQMNTCTEVVPPGAGCSFSVQFNPTAPGNMSGTLTLIDNVTGSPHNIPLTGLSSTPTSLTLSASPATALAGSQVTFTVNLQSAIGSPTGAVSFQDGGNFLATAQIASGVATYSTTSLSPGSHTITASYTGTGGFSSSTSSSVGVVMQGFSIAVTSGNISLSPGQSATAMLTVAPIGGFTGSVSITCQVPGAMSETSCSATSVQIAGTSAQNSTLTLNTTGPHQTATLRAAWREWYRWGFAVCVVLCLKKKRRRRWFVTAATVALAILPLSSCGGGGSTSAAMSDPGTPAGGYTLTIVASSGTATQTISESVTVK
jgi:hypothetical protein